MNKNLIIALNAIEGKHDLELGVYDDLKLEMKNANIGAMKAIDLANSAKKPAQDSLNANKELLVKFENFVKQIKALGIESPQLEVEKAITQVKTNIKVTESVINALNKI
jgi:hypothetical protein